MRESEKDCKGALNVRGLNGPKGMFSVIINPCCIGNKYLEICRSTVWINICKLLNERIRKQEVISINDSNFMLIPGSTTFDVANYIQITIA